MMRLERMWSNDIKRARSSSAHPPEDFSFVLLTGRYRRRRIFVHGDGGGWILLVFLYKRNEIWFVESIFNSVLYRAINPIEVV